MPVAKSARVHYFQIFFHIETGEERRSTKVGGAEVHAKMNTAKPESRRKEVVSLKTQASLYIFDHLWEYTVESLSILPATVRAELLISLPPLDIARLENTKFTAEVNMETVWEILLTKLGYSAVTKFMLPTVKESYMNVMGGLVINAISQCKDVTTAYIAFLMLGSKKCFGITKWRKFFAENPAMKRYGSEIHNDVVVPHRYFSLLDANKDLEDIIINIFLNKCNFYMLQVLIQEQFINSELWEDNVPNLNLVKAIGAMTSKVRTMNYINSFTGSKYHDDRNCMIRAIRTLTKEILNNKTERKELCFVGQTYDNINTLMMSATPHFVGDAAFTKLKNIAFSVADPTFRKKDIYTFYHRAAKLIHSQDALSEVRIENVNMGLDCREIRELLNALIHCLTQSNSEGLVLIFRDLPINPLVFQLLIKSFLLVKTERRQEIYLENVTIDESCNCMFSPERSTQELLMPDDGCCYKSLTLKDMKLNSSFTNWIFHPLHHLRFSTLKLEEIKVELSVVTRHPNMSVLNLEATEICIPHNKETSDDFHKLLSNKMSKTLILKNCNIGKDGVLQDLTMALRKLRRQQGTMTLKVLDLTENKLGSESDRHLRLFFTALFHVVSVNKMEIRLKGNNFSFNQLRFINKARKYCQGQAPNVTL